MMESEFRQDLRRALSAIFMDTDEEHPMETDIHLDVNEACGLSSLELPNLVRAWQVPGEGLICFEVDGTCYDFDSFRTQELIQIFEELSAEHPVELL